MHKSIMHAQSKKEYDAIQFYYSQLCTEVTARQLKVEFPFLFQPMSLGGQVCENVCLVSLPV